MRGKLEQPASLFNDLIIIGVIVFSYISISQEVGNRWIER